MAANAKLFFGGLPTGPDVRKLEELYGIPPEGTLIAYDEIVGVLKLPTWRCARFKIVLDTWRRKLARESNVDTACDPGKGLRVLTEPERIVETKSDFRMATRKTRKSARRAHMIRVERLEVPAQRAEAELIQRISFQAFEFMAGTVKKLSPPSVTKALPR